MIKIISVENMRKIEAASDAAGNTYDMMMQSAGRAAALRVLQYIRGHDHAQVTVLVGPGNNGGDGLVAGRVIAEESSALVRFYLLHKRDPEDPNLKAAHDAGLLVVDAEDDQRYRVLHHMIASSHVLVDGLFGIGLSLPLRSNAVKLLRQIRAALSEIAAEPEPTSVIDPATPQLKPRNRPYIIAVDCPSGLQTDTGEMDDHTLFADETVTFIAAKPGLLTFPGAEAVGRLFVAPIEIPPDLPELKRENRVLADAGMIRPLLPVRSPNAHKGSTGRALIAAGSRHYFGAPALAAAAAYRSGAGLVTIAAPPVIIRTLAANLHEPTWLPLADSGDMPGPQAADILLAEVAKSKAWLAGPGWGTAEETRSLFTTLLDHLNADTPPLVIDADGLNLLAETETWWERLPQNTILTPHPGEMARLTQSSTGEVQANRWMLASEKAKAWGVIVVLKGAHTLVAEPDGRLTALPFKTDALATAGTGDVLAGIIVGLLAQGMEPYNAAVTGTYLHGMAGVIAAEQAGSSRSVIAGDIITALGAAYKQLI